MDNVSFYDHARDVAADAAQSAADVIRRHAQRRGELRVSEKGTHDLVTQADLEAQRAIVDRLQKAFPDHDILAEESAPAEAELDAMAPHSNGYRWVIDPLDGTTNFTHGIPTYAVSIALQDGEHVVVGVVLDVARSDLFTAVRGRGLYHNGARAGVSERSALGESLLTTGFPYRAFDELDAYLRVMAQFMRQARGLRRPGASAIDLAYVACGRFDGFFETGLGPWDVAAGMLLIEEGGGRVTDYRGATPSIFARQILATNGRIHQAMLDVLRPVWEARS